MFTNFKNITLCLYFVLNSIVLSSQNKQRPFIWVKQQDRTKILHKIETQDWAKSFYKEFKARLDYDIISYKISPNTFISSIPFNWSEQKKGITPPLKTFKESNDANNLDRYLQFKYLQIGIDCGVLYFLTEDESYAQCALDILHAYVEGLLQIQPSNEKGNGGWLYPSDHLREARVIGAQIPIIYDFIASYIEKNKPVFDIGKGDYTKFSIQNAQKVFLTYAKLAVEHGHTGSNWSVLESFSLVHNALALNNAEQRKTYLDFYITQGTNTQDALPNVSEQYQNEGDVYPETSQYSNGVAGYTTQMLLILDRYDPSLQLGTKYYKIPYSLDRWNNIRYPNNEIIRFGDGHRDFSVPYNSYDFAYLLGKEQGISKLTEKFGPLITKALKSGKYDRSRVGPRSGGISVYNTPTQLLWLNETKEYSIKNTALPRTDKFSHAGVFLQRNLSSTKNPEYGLMSFVGGAHMVHGHASGMDMELYGLGQVLGVDNGRGAYRTNLHENYSRLFAAHNTVVVNGASQGEGGWVNLGMNSTTLESMEPMPLAKAISPYHSFSRTSFLDDKGSQAEAIQERTMALVRTSPTTGYYVDVFRSKSALPNEYHDYIYHNIGDHLKLINKDIRLKSDKDRYKEDAKSTYKYNKQYRNPGWHFFNEVKSTQEYQSDVKATFEIKKLKDKKRYMNLFILGNKDREYTTAMAPKTFEAPKPYDELPTPTLVIRQKGEAWTNPFAVIYEPTFSKDTKNNIKAVTKLTYKGVFKGFKVISEIKNKEITQYIINQEDGAIYENKDLNISFKGSFAIITINEKKKIDNLYIGKGYLFRSSGVNITSKNDKTIAAYVNFSSDEKEINVSTNTLIDVEYHTKQDMKN